MYSEDEDTAVYVRQLCGWLR